jgi:hypothetical protein
MFHQIRGEKNIINYWIFVLEWWIGLKQARSSWGFQQFLYFAFLCDFIKSQHFKQRILILVKLENVLQY